MVIGCKDGSLNVYEESGPFTAIPAHSGSITDIQISLSGEWALTTSWDGTLRALDLREMASPRVIGNHKERILACAIDLDGRLAVTASADRTLRIWDVEEGNGPLLQGHDDQVTDCAFTRDGTRVISCSLDGTLGVWDVRAGALLHRLRGHQDWVNAFVIDDDQGVVYSCSEDRTVRAWDLESGEARGVVYGVSPFRSLALTYDGVAAGDEAGNFWALELIQAQEEAIPEARFDIFLSYNSRDQAAVQEVAETLRNRGLKVWFAVWRRIRAEVVQESLVEGMQSSRSIAVLFGKDGIGAMQEWEIQRLLSEPMGPGRTIIPVLLPGAPEAPKLPLGLQDRNWADFRGGLTEEGLDQLVWGITGERPGRP